MGIAGHLNQLLDITQSGAIGCITESAQSGAMAEMYLPKSRFGGGDTGAIGDITKSDGIRCNRCITQSGRIRCNRTEPNGIGCKSDGIWQNRAQILM